MATLNDSLIARLDHLHPSPATLHDAWVLAETEATLALAAWFEAPGRAKAAAYAAYRTAQAHEESAAAALAASLTRRSTDWRTS